MTSFFHKKIFQILVYVFVINIIVHIGMKITVETYDINAQFLRNFREKLYLDNILSDTKTDTSDRYSWRLHGYIPSDQYDELHKGVASSLDKDFEHSVYAKDFEAGFVKTHKITSHVNTALITTLLVCGGMELLYAHVTKNGAAANDK